MSTLAADLKHAVARDVTSDEAPFTVDLADGRVLSVPLAWFPRLFHGTHAERANWRLIGAGERLHWPDLDDDISVRSLLAGDRSPETQESLRPWLQSRPR